MSITWLAASDQRRFPPVDQATENGLLAAGGDLSARRLLEAYRSGIFPWFNQNDPILWWSPDPRMILMTEAVHISKTLNRLIRQHRFNVSFDTAFTEVMQACSAPRANQETEPGDHSWIHDDVIQAYSELHEMGQAHSVECWLDGQLVGGLYGVAIGSAFFGESMFSLVKDSSKVALVALCQQLSRWNMPMVDCQIYSDHLASMGAVEISRREFIDQLTVLCEDGPEIGKWQLDADIPHCL
jgi:leucyl/phenylalanyl-tRNA--protein transferase